MDEGVLAARRSFMARLPHRYAPVACGIIQVAITTAVATAIAVVHSSDPGVGSLLRWATTWLVAWLLMLPVVILISPLVHRLVAVLTGEETR